MKIMSEGGTARFVFLTITLQKVAQEYLSVIGITLFCLFCDLSENDRMSPRRKKPPVVKPVHCPHCIDLCQDVEWQNDLIDHTEKTSVVRHEKRDESVTPKSVSEHVSHREISFARSPICALDWIEDDLALVAFEQDSNVYVIRSSIDDLSLVRTIDLMDDDQVISIRSQTGLAGLCLKSGLIKLYLTLTHDIIDAQVVFSMPHCPCTVMDWCQVRPGSLCAGYSTGHVALYSLRQANNSTAGNIRQFSPDRICLPADVTVGDLKYLPGSDALIAVSYMLIRELFIYDMMSKNACIARIDAFVPSLAAHCHCPYLFCVMDEKVGGSDKVYVKALNMAKQSTHALSRDFDGNIVDIDFCHITSMLALGTSLGEVFTVNTKRLSEKSKPARSNYDYTCVLNVMYRPNTAIQPLDSDVLACFSNEPIHVLLDRGLVTVYSGSDAIDDQGKLAKERASMGLDQRSLYPNSIARVRFHKRDHRTLLVATHGGSIIAVKLS